MYTRSWNGLIAVAALALSASALQAQVSTVNFLGGTDGGYVDANVAGLSNPWQYDITKGWFVNGITNPSAQALLSPVLTTSGSSWGLSFSHRYSFEQGSTTVGFDGGLVRMSVNGGAFAEIGTLGAPYNFTLSTGFSNPLGGSPAFSGTSGSFGTTTFSGALAAGSTVQFEFLGTWDNSAISGDPNWQLQSVTYRDLSITTTTTPEPSTYALMSAGLLIVGGVARRRQNRAG